MSLPPGEISSNDSEYIFEGITDVLKQACWYTVYLHMRRVKLVKLNFHTGSF